jgi:hypothetical protein
MVAATFSMHFVVAFIMLVVCISSVVIAFIPSAITVQREALNLVSSVTDAVMQRVHFDVHRRYRNIRQGVDVLHRAATQQNLMKTMDPLVFASWAGSLVLREDVGAHLILRDNRGFALSSASTVNNGEGMTNFVFVENATEPGVFLKTGFFQLNTNTPANSEQPWTRLNSSALFSAQGIASDIFNLTNRIADLAWTRVGPRNSSRTPSSVIGFGGPVYHLDDTDPGRREQFVGVTERGENAADYFASLKMTTSGVAMLVDVASGALIGGSITDPSATLSADGSPVLTTLSAIQDARVASIIHAARGATGDGESASQLLTCTDPCFFAFWPHDGSLGSFSGLFDVPPRGAQATAHSVFIRSFIAVRVRDIQDDAGLHLRLILIVPADDVIANFRKGIWIGALVPFVVVPCLSLVLALVVFLLLAPLRLVEKILAMHIHEHCDDNRNINESELLALLDYGLQRAAFSEVASILRALSRLVIELRLLAAFSSSSSLYKTSTTVARRRSTTTTTTTTTTDADATVAARHTEDAGPTPVGAARMTTGVYGSGGFWEVPVTVVTGLVDGLRTSSHMHHEEPMLMLELHKDVIAALQYHVARFVGGSLASFYGDVFMLHFNAVDRTVGHALAAVDVMLAFFADLRWQQPPSVRQTYQPRSLSVYAGMSTEAAVCGLMGGTNALRTFTIISPCVNDAALLCRLAHQKQFPMLLSWRTVVAVRTLLDRHPQLPLDQPPPPSSAVPSSYFSSPTGKSQLTTATATTTTTDMRSTSRRFPFAWSRRMAPVLDVVGPGETTVSQAWTVS